MNIIVWGHWSTEHFERHMEDMEFCGTLFGMGWSANARLFAVIRGLDER